MHRAVRKVFILLLFLRLSVPVLADQTQTFSTSHIQLPNVFYFSHGMLVISGPSDRSGPVLEDISFPFTESLAALSQAVKLLDGGVWSIEIPTRMMETVGVTLCGGDGGVQRYAGQHVPAGRGMCQRFDLSVSADSLSRHWRSSLLLLAIVGGFGNDATGSMLSGGGGGGASLLWLHRRLLGSWAPRCILLAVGGGGGGAGGNRVRSTNESDANATSTASSCGLPTHACPGGMLDQTVVSSCLGREGGYFKWGTLRVGSCGGLGGSLGGGGGCGQGCGGGAFSGGSNYVAGFGGGGFGGFGGGGSGGRGGGMVGGGGGGGCGGGTGGDGGYNGGGGGSFVHTSLVDDVELTNISSYLRWREQTTRPRRTTAKQPGVLILTLKCHPGHVTSNILACSACPKGTFAFSNEKCHPCPKGTYAPEDGSTGCIKQPLNSTVTEDGCSYQCNPGYFHKHDKTGCLRCEQGRIQPEFGQVACTACPKGTFTETQEFCQSCPKGTYAPEEASISCMKIPVFVTVTWYVKVAGGFLFLVCCCLLLPLSMGHIIGVPIADITVNGDRLVVSTNSQHFLLPYAKFPTQAFLHGTGHPGLDDPKVPFKARCISSFKVELIMSGDIDHLYTSKGYLRTHMLSGFYARGIYLPFCLLTPGWTFGILYFGMPFFAHPWLYTCPLACFMALLISAHWHMHGRRTPLHSRIHAHRQDLAAVHKPTRSVRGHGRGVTGQQLVRLHEHFKDLILDRNAYYLVSNIVVPLTESAQLSYAEYAGGCAAIWFVSHFWGTEFRHFCRTIESHAKHVSPDRWCDNSYWICFLSNNQWEVKLELGEEDGGWLYSSFYLTLQSGVLGTVMVLDNCSLALTRSWCLFEVLQTFLLEQNNQQSSEQTHTGSRQEHLLRRDDFKGLLLCTESGILNYGTTSIEAAMSIAHRLTDLRLENAGASSNNDKIMIDNLVTEELGGFDKINGFVKAKMLLALQSCGDHFQRDFNTLLAALAANSVSALPKFPVYNDVVRKTREEGLRYRRSTTQLSDDVSIFMLSRNPRNNRGVRKALATEVGSTDLQQAFATEGEVELAHATSETLLV